MKLPPRQTSKGQPLTALGVLLIGWVGFRSALWAASPPELVEPLNVVAPTAAESGKSADAPAAPDYRAERRRPDHSAHERKIAPRPADPTAPRQVVPLDPQQAPVTQVEAPPAYRIAAAHSLLRMAALAPAIEPESVAVGVPLAAPAVTGVAGIPFLPAAREEALRWSADGWILWREGRNGLSRPGAIVPGGTYGASQAGLVLRYRISPNSDLKPTLYLRASSGLYAPRGEEAAVGLSLRPVRGLPLAIMGEGRVTRTVGGTTVRPAIAVVSELPPVRLPAGLRGEAYGQAGWVGGTDATGFVDGQARLDKPVWQDADGEFRIGAGAWGGAQKGARRLDVGPTATLDLPVGRVNTRLSADYRFRVSGDAAPGSGVAVTFSAGF